MEITFLPTNTSTCGTTPTEHLLNAGRRPQTSQKARNSPCTWVGQKKTKKQRQKNRDGTCPSGRELWRRKSFHILGSPFTGGDGGWQGGKLWSHGGEHSNRGAEGKVEKFHIDDWCQSALTILRGLNELQRWAGAVAISVDPRDGHETLRLLPPPRSLCASTGHSPHLPSWEPGQPATARVPWSRDNFPGRTHGMRQPGATSRWTLPPQACPASIPLPPPGLSEPEPPNQLLL